MKKSTMYMPEIEGLRGIACLIVLIGHSVACIFPAVYFGETYKQHSLLETYIHGTPLNLLFNGSAMVMIFFIISGYLMGQKKKHRNIFDLIVKRYIRYLPMVVIGIVLSALVMYFHCVNSYNLAEYSYAGKYVYMYNDFTPKIFGKDGVIFESIVKVFLVGSDYNRVLWYISVAFMGDIAFSILCNFLNDCKYKKFILKMIIIFLWLLGIEFWQLQYVSGIAMGILIADIEVKFDKITSSIIFIIGLLLLSFEDKGASGVYAPLQYISNWIVPIWCVGGAMILLGIMLNKHIGKVFKRNTLIWFGKYSFAIYALQWPVIISVSCGICLIFIKMGISYNFAGIIGIFVGACVTIGLAVFIQKRVYNPVYKVLLLGWNKIYKEKYIRERI